MNCKQIQKQLRETRELDALSDDARAHITQCGDCSRVVSTLRVERLLLSAASRVETPEPLRGFERRVIQRIESSAAPRPETALVLGRLAWRLVPSLAVLLVVLTVASFWLLPNQESSLSDLANFDGGWGEELAQLESME